MLLPDARTKNIWDTLDSMRFRLNKLFYETPSYSAPERHPLMNVWASNEKAVVHVLAPGVDLNEIDIQVSGQALLLQINRKNCEEGSCQRQERWTTESARSIQLPFPVDAEKVEARLNDGLLAIELPRMASDMPRKIPVKS